MDDSQVYSSDSDICNTGGGIDLYGENEFSMLLIDNILVDLILGILIAISFKI